MAKSKIKDKDLLGIIESEIAHASSNIGDVSTERKNALLSFKGHLYGNEREGRAKVVTREVQETVLWALPLILKLFSDDGVVRFEPSTPGAVDRSMLKTAFAQHVLSRHNNKTELLYAWFFDALLMKNSTLKVYYDKTPTKKRRELDGVTSEELAILEQDDRFEVVETSIDGDVMDVDPLTGLPIIRHKVTALETTRKNGKIIIELIPSEELLVSNRARRVSLEDSPFVAHRVRRTLSYIRKQGYKVADDIADDSPLPDDSNLSNLRNDSYQEDYGSHAASKDPSSREVWLTEAYLRVDYDGDGVAELRKIVKVGSKILDNQEVVTLPFITICPIPLPHKHYGLSLADLVVDLQKLKSNLMRAIFDSFYANLSPKRFINRNIVNLDDLLDDDPAAMVQVDGDPSAAVKESVANSIAPEAFTIVQYLDDQAESRTGVSKLTQGLNAENMHATASGATMAMTASQEKIALIARLFAEMGVAPLYSKIITLASEYFEEPEPIMVDGEFVPVDPREWDDTDYLTVDVGLGTLDKTSKLNGLREIYTLQKELSTLPEGPALVQVQNIYATISRLTQTLGFKEPAEFINNPSGAPFQAKMQEIQSRPPMPDPNMALVEVEKQKAIDASVNKAAEIELKRREASMKFELELVKILGAERGMAIINEIHTEADQLTAPQIPQGPANLPQGPGLPPNLPPEALAGILTGNQPPL